MPRLTVTLSDDRADRITEMVEDGEYDSKSAAMNELIDRGERVTEVERENDRLRSEKRAIIQQREDNDELVEWAGEHRNLLEDEYERRNAPVWKRIEWFVFGRE